MRKLVEFLGRLGVVEGLTFRAVIEDGVGPVLVPNPRPTRAQVNTTPAPSHRAARRRVSGRWVAKPLYVAW